MTEALESNINAIAEIVFDALKQLYPEFGTTPAIKADIVDVLPHEQSTIDAIVLVVVVHVTRPMMPLVEHRFVCTGFSTESFPDCAVVRGGDC